MLQRVTSLRRRVQVSQRLDESIMQGCRGRSLQCIIAVFSQIYPGFQDPDFNLNPASAYT